MDLTTGFIDFINVIIGFLPLFFLGLITIAAVVAYRSGFIFKHPFNVVVVSPRVGSPKLIMARGRKLSGKQSGMFEILYGFTEKVQVQAPLDEWIHPDNTLFCLRTSETDHTWCELRIDQTRIKLDPTSNPAMRTIYASAMKEETARYTEENWLVKNAPAVAFIVAIVIIGLAQFLAADKYYAGAKIQSDAFLTGADNIAGAFSKAVNITETTQGTQATQPQTPPPPWAGILGGAT